MRFTIVPTHISQIRQGDYIEHQGEVVTVSNQWIKNCPFMGPTLYGDSYNLGTKMVKKVVYERSA